MVKDYDDLDHFKEYLLNHFMIYTVGHKDYIKGPEILFFVLRSIRINTREC